MTQPLALIFYEKLLPGTQLVNRMQDLGYRVQTANASEAFLNHAATQTPMLVLADLISTRSKVSDAILQLRQNPATTHLPVIAFSNDRQAALQTSAREAGATLVVSDTAILTHLEQFLEQALQLD